MGQLVSGRIQRIPGPLFRERFKESGSKSTTATRCGQDAERFFLFAPTSFRSALNVNMMMVGKVINDRSGKHRRTAGYSCAGGNEGGAAPVSPRDNRH
jgi:hypothetical protein